MKLAKVTLPFIHWPPIIS